MSIITISCWQAVIWWHNGGASSAVLDSKVDLQTYTSESESHWVPPSYDLVQHLSKKLSKLQYGGAKAHDG